MPDIPLRNCTGLCPIGMVGERGRKGHSAPVANVLWPRCYCKAINLGLASRRDRANGTADSPLSNFVAIYCPALNYRLSLHPPPLLFPVLFACPMARALSYWKSCGPERLSHRDSSFETFHEKLDRDLLILAVLLSYVFVTFLDFVKISSYLWDKRLFFTTIWFSVQKNLRKIISIKETLDIIKASIILANISE